MPEEWGEIRDPATAVRGLPTFWLLPGLQGPGKVVSWVAKTRRLKEFECETAGCQDGAVSGAHRDWGYPVSPAYTPGYTCQTPFWGQAAILLPAKESVSTGWGHRPSATEKSIITPGPDPALGAKILNEKNRV